MRGLLGRAGLDDGEGMLFSRTSSVHTFFMRFPIDVVFLDDGFTVLSIDAAVRPWRTASRKGASWTLELAAGRAQRVGLAPGDTLTLEDVAS
jgi:uncharacterized membrane protein (UPF0127 family)